MTRQAASHEAPLGMPEHLVKFLQGGRSVIVATLDGHGRPTTTLMTWVVARDPHTVAIAVGNPGRAYTNMVERKHVALEILGDDVTWGLRGHARVEREKMTSAPFPSALVVVHIDEAKDHAAKGVHFKGPSYTFAEDKKHRLEVEKAVFDELRGS